MKAKLVGGDEYDALTRAKRFHRWRAGMRKLIKRKFWKRQRRQEKVSNDKNPSLLD